MTACRISALCGPTFVNSNVKYVQVGSKSLCYLQYNGLRRGHRHLSSGGLAQQLASATLSPLRPVCWTIPALFVAALQRRTPLMNATLSKSDDMATLVMDYSVTLQAVDVQWGWTALHCAAHVGMVKVAESLLGKRASPYATSKVQCDYCKGGIQKWKVPVELRELVAKQPFARKRGRTGGFHETVQQGMKYDPFHLLYSDPK